MACAVGKPCEGTRRGQPGRHRQNDEIDRAAFFRQSFPKFDFRFALAGKRSWFMKSLLLPPLSALYGAVTRTHLALYQRGTFRTVKLERPVISVGNITAGGTGKTPLV